jgi:acyl-CoA thioesterase-2
MGDFEQDTRLVGENGRYTATLSRDWEIWGPNGGYLASIALRAAGAEAAIQRPACFAGQFLHSADFAQVEIEVSVPRRGRRSEALSVVISQDAKPVLLALVRTACEGPGLEHDAAIAPAAPRPEDVPPTEDPPRHPFWRNLETHWIDPPPEAFDEMLESGRGLPPRRLSWHRFAPRALFDDPFLDAARSLLLIDTLTWPAASLPHPNSAFIAPNLDVTTWFHRSASQSDWLLVEHTSPVAEAGLMGTSGRVFDAAGRLIASGGAQLFCVPRPPEA